MRETRGKRVVTWVLAAVLLVEPAVSFALVDDSLAQFFNSFSGSMTATPFGAYATQSRGYLTGGNLSARVPMQATQLASIQPPRFNLGCNGFDATFGGLSYVSFDRFIQLLQQLGTGAVMGFAFQLAIEYLSPTIGGVLSKMEAAARFINTQLNVAPCQTGMAIGRMLASQNYDDLGQTWQRWRTSLGQVTDPVHSIEEVASRTSADVAAAMGNDPQWTIKGNVVYDALWNGFPGVFTLDDIRMIMSLVGTVIVGDDGTPVRYEGILKPETVIDAVPGAPYSVYNCADPCLDLTIVQDTTFTGLAFRFNAIAARMVEDAVTNGPVSGADARLLDYSAIPIYSLLKHARGNRLSMDRIAQTSSRLIAASALSNYLHGLLNRLTIAVSKYHTIKPNVKIDLSEVYAATREAIKAADRIALNESQRLHSETALTNQLLLQSEWSNRRR